MNGLGTLDSVAERFTTVEEFDKYEAFLNAQKTNLGDLYDTRLKNMNTAKTNNLAWDQQYMKEFMDHLTKLKNSAPMKTISVFVSIISLAVLFLFN